MSEIKSKDTIFKSLKSDEEREFFAWLCEANEAGLVTGIQYEPKSYVLSEKHVVLAQKEYVTKVKKIKKIKTVKKHLHRPHSYTPDFSFFVNVPFFDFELMYPRIGKIFVDTKGNFLNSGARQEFSINQKWMYEKYGIHINKVIPEKIFKATWVPEYARYSKVQSKERRKYIGSPTVEQFLDKVGVAA